MAQCRGLKSRHEQHQYFRHPKSSLVVRFEVLQLRDPPIGGPLVPYFSDSLLTHTEVAHRLGMGPGRARDILTRDGVPIIRLTDRTWRVRSRDYDNWERKTTTDPPSKSNQRETRGAT